MQQVPEEASQQRSETPSYRQKGLLASIAGGLVIATLLAAAVWRSGVLPPVGGPAAMGHGTVAQTPLIDGLTPLPPAVAASPAFNAGTSKPGAGAQPVQPAGPSQAQLEAAQQQQAALDAQKKALEDTSARLVADAAAHKKALDDAAAQRDAALAARQKALDEQTATLTAAAAANKAKVAAVYSGPSSGDIVWQGPVSGQALITISGSSSDIGEVVSGKLPGVHVLLALADNKHVRVASAPAPSNGYGRIVLGATGKGDMRITVHWSIP